MKSDNIKPIDNHENFIHEKKSISKRSIINNNNHKENIPNVQSVISSNNDNKQVVTKIIEKEIIKTIPQETKINLKIIDNNTNDDKDFEMNEANSNKTINNNKIIIKSNKNSILKYTFDKPQVQNIKVNENKIISSLKDLKYAINDLKPDDSNSNDDLFHGASTSYNLYRNSQKNKVTQSNDDHEKPKIVSDETNQSKPTDSGA